MAVSKLVVSVLLMVTLLTTMGLGCTSMNGISRKAVLMGLDKNLKPIEQQRIEETLKRLNESNNNNNDDDGGSQPAQQQNNYGTSYTTSQMKEFNSVYSVKQSNQNKNKNSPIFIPHDTHNDHGYNETMMAGKLLGFNMTYHELKETLEGIDHDHNETKQGHTSIQWFYPRQRNITFPIQVQSLTKSSEYIGFKFLNVSSSDSGDNATVKTADFLNDSVEMVDDTDPKTGRKSLTSHLSQPYNLTMERLTKLEEGGGGHEKMAENLHNPVNIVEEEVFDPEEDRKVNGDWGGNCTVKHWISCYNITVMGDSTEVNPQFPHDKKKNRKTQLNCFDTMESKYFPWLCLRNGWTVNRCHLLCMAKRVHDFCVPSRPEVATDYNLLKLGTTLYIDHRIVLDESDE